MLDDKAFDNLSKLSSANVLCIGDIMLDRFVYGEVSRISPEAPIPVLNIQDKKYMLGGVGNVIANINGLTAKPHLITIIGDDLAGDRVKRQVSEISQDISGIITDKSRPTTIKTRYLSLGQHLLRTDTEQLEAISQDIETEVINKVQEKINEIDVIVLSDYGKGLLTKSLIQAIITLGNKNNKTIIIDPKGTDYRIYKGATIVTPNRKELSEATSGMKTKTDDEVRAAAYKLILQSGVKSVIATRSEDGISIIETENKPIHIKTDVKKVYDVSGAGDTVVAAISSGIGSGMSLEESAEIANIAGGIVVGKTGTSIIKIEEIERKISYKMARKKDLEKNNYSLEEIVILSNEWKEEDLKVGFTNGCFDLLHPGHLSLLKLAKSRCDKLIVAVNSDISVKKNKGPTRPIHNETSRSMMLTALEYVDAVIIFDSETPMPQIEAIKPDILIKGGDYTIETVVGADYIHSYGGEVYVAPSDISFPTTKIIEKISA